MTALTAPQQNRPTTPPHGPALTGPIKCWLLDEPTDFRAIETIKASDILKREAKAAMPALREAALRPATRDEIKAIIGQRFALFPQPQRNDGEWAAWWADYFDALEGLTAPAIEAGMAAWVRSVDAEFMCKPGKLRDLAQTVPNENRWARAYYRAERATYVAPLPSPEPKRSEEGRPSREEVRAQVAATLAALQEKDTFARFRKQTVRTPRAQVDETGVSAEMRALLEGKVG